MKIKRLRVKNFKSLRDVDIELGNLTLITGVNSSGKSSLIQALLLLKQNEEKFYTHRGDKMVNINDRYVTLGNKKDILSEGAYKENIKISIWAPEQEHILSFDNDTLRIAIDELLPDESFNLFFDDFQYIQTDRIAPQISYPLSDEQISKGLIGFKGEYSAHYLAINRHKKIVQSLCHEKAKTNQLLENVSLWLSEISQNIEVKAKVFDELQQADLKYTYTYGDTTTGEYTPLNVGFGITYVLPIIVALLKAKEGDLLMIENPESHLHPKAQAQIAKLCALVSSLGVQVILETHSDHVLNGVRVATKKGLIAPSQTTIYYLSKATNQLETNVDRLSIDSEGKINERWPEGFFDEYENLLDELLW